MSISKCNYNRLQLLYPSPMEDRLDIFGYYMAAWGYEYFILMLIVFLFKVLTDFDASLHWYFHLKIKPRPMQLKYNCRI